MRKLLSAGFARLKRDKVFWLGMLFMAAMGAIFAFERYTFQQQVDAPQPLQGIITNFALFIGFASAAFCSLFIGTEYSDGAIRNKLVVGHTRVAIYLSNLILVTAASLCMVLAYLVVTCAVGIPLLGPISASAMPHVLILLLGGVMMTIAFAAIYTLVGMLCQNKALTAIVCVIGVIAVFVAASYLGSALDEPEFMEGYVFQTNESTVTVYDSTASDMPTVPNPRYLQGTARTVYQLLYDILPAGQALQIFLLSAPNALLLPLYALAIILVTTGCGVYFFRKKDLK